MKHRIQVTEAQTRSLGRARVRLGPPRRARRLLSSGVGASGGAAAGAQSSMNSALAATQTAMLTEMQNLQAQIAHNMKASHSTRRLMNDAAGMGNVNSAAAHQDNMADATNGAAGNIAGTSGTASGNNGDMLAAASTLQDAAKMEEVARMEEMLAKAQMNAARGS